MEDNDHVIFVGSKPFMNYVTGVVMQFTTQNAENVVVKARGKFISKAVDIAEVAAKRFDTIYMNLLEQCFLKGRLLSAILKHTAKSSRTRKEGR